MANKVTWDNVPTQIVEIIGSKVGSLDDYIRFSSVCKTWQSAMSERREAEKAIMLLPLETPLLFLAEEVQGTLLSCNIDDDEDEDGYEEDVDDVMEEIIEEEEVEEITEEEDVDDEVEEITEEDDEEAESEEEEDGEDYGDEDMDVEDNEQDDGEEKESKEEDVEEDGEDYEDEDMEMDDELEEITEEEEEESGEDDEEDDGEDYGDEDMEVDLEQGLDEDMEVDPEERGDGDMRVGPELQPAGFEGNLYNPYQYCLNRYYRLKISVGSARGIYSLSTRKLYTIELPEAAGKVIMGISKGWVLTLGEDFQTNLLHPVLRQEISLPNTRIVRLGIQYSSFEGVVMLHVRKAAMSSELQRHENVLGNDRSNPTIMIIYGEGGYLGFASPGDKVWTKVDVPRTSPFIDIAYHRGKFYGVNWCGDTFVCHIDDDDGTNGRHATGTLIVNCPTIGPITKPADRDFEEKYLVDSGCDLWLLVRLRRIKNFKPPNNFRIKYRTTRFFVWKLEQGVSKDGLQTVHTWIPRKNLDNMAFFVGRNSSVSLPSSSCISPNSIYFTDDARDLYFPEGGGHDMGIYNVETCTIVRLFPGKSLHPVSTPFWYT